MARGLHLSVLSGLVAWQASGCAASHDAEPLGALSAPIVYGDDDRREGFETSDPLRSRLAESAVALVPKSSIDRHDLAALHAAPTWAEEDALCADEPFADQPAPAFCSGVLVDWDLVLTAGHCVRQLALDDFVVVMGYYYRAPEELDIAPYDVLQPVKIESEALDPPGAESRLDYSWLRLSTRARPPRRPAPVYTLPPELGPDDEIVSMSTAGGTPIKVDAGARVRDPRGSVLDYFVADTDTSHGSSGGGAFATDLALLGILSRGAPDVLPSEAGCNTTARVAAEAAAEEFTYAHRAVTALCESGDRSSLCRPDCPNPCEALPLLEEARAACSLAAHTRICHAATPWHCLAALSLSLLLRRRQLRLSRRT